MRIMNVPKNSLTTYLVINITLRVNFTVKIYNFINGITMEGIAFVFRPFIKLSNFL